MLRRCIVFFIVIFYCSTVHAGESPLMPEELFKTLEAASKKTGVQVGLIVDPHNTSNPEKIFAEIITLPKGEEYTAQDVLDNSQVDKHYETRKYPGNMGKLLHCLMGAEPTIPNIQNEMEKMEKSILWYFFTYNRSNGTWILPMQGISNTPVSDGDLIGFSLTKVKNSGKKDEAGFSIYNPIDEPRTRISK
jgi:hypothetical protein